MNGGLIFLLILLIIPVVIAAIIVPFVIIDKKYKDFVLLHSSAIKELKEINNHYRFKFIKRYDQVNTYDNENFYDTISTKDYLIYQLVYIQYDVMDALNEVVANRTYYEKYKKEIAERCHWATFDTNVLPKNKKRLIETEKRLFEKAIKSPTTEYSISVRLRLVKMDGTYVRGKQNTFYEKEIRSLIARINNRRNGFYLDDEIWKSICRVERGKVSNKLRFAIYARDGKRCRKCGRRTDDLEIDHIIPIAKGGKSTPDNLQTLCRACNKAKGSNLEQPGNGYYRW